MKIELNIDFILKEFQHSIDCWYSLDRVNDKKLYQNDRKQMKAVLSLLKKGKVKQSYEQAMGLDTILREHIPDSVWKFYKDMENYIYESI